MDTALAKINPNEVPVQAPKGFALPEDLSFKSIISKPLIIDRAEQDAYFDTMRSDDKGAALELLLDLSKRAPDTSMMRWAGGCKGFSAEQLAQFLPYTAAGSVSLDGKRIFQGSVGSGGTMDIGKDGTESLMVCQIPPYLARIFPCVSWGSTPQTHRLRIPERGGVSVSKYGTMLDPRDHMNVLSQTNLTEFQGWDGDVRWYVEGLAKCQAHGHKVAVGIMNGGDITLDEALLSLSKGVPVIIVEGSGRAADTLAKHAKDGTLQSLYTAAFARGLLKTETDKVPALAELYTLTKVVDFNNPRTLSLAMDELGMLKPIA